MLAKLAKKHAEGSKQFGFLNCRGCDSILGPRTPQADMLTTVLSPRIGVQMRLIWPIDEFGGKMASDLTRTVKLSVGIQLANCYPKCGNRNGYFLLLLHAAA